MRLLSFTYRGSLHYGAVVDDGIVDLGRRLGEYYTDLHALIAGGEQARLRAEAACKSATPDLDPRDIGYALPIARPGKIWCIGVNYRDRNAEYRDDSDLPEYPSLFARSPTSFVGHGAPIIRPVNSAQLDYEGELVLVIGKRGRHIPRAKALDHVWGMTLANEGTVRDWLHHGKFNVTQGKNFDRSGSIGPWIVTADECLPSALHRIETRVNGELRQSDDTGRLMFPFDFLIAYLTQFATLEPGDMILTGTPTGAGARLDPPVWLKPGDIVTVTSPRIGTLQNIVEEEAVHAVV